MKEATGPIRVMVVDDSALVRGLWARLIDQEEDMQVVASAWHGRAALDILRRKDVDIVLLDIEMPEMDGLTALPQILELQPQARVIMVSTLTRNGAEVTIRALSLGAVDYVAKPQAAGGGSDMEHVGIELVRKIRALRRRRTSSAALGRPPESAPEKPQWAKTRVATDTPRALAVTSSTGGPNALMSVLACLPSDFPLPIVIVQHMPPLFTEMLAQRLDRAIDRPCAEATNGTEVLPGHTYVAPGDKHLVLMESSGQVVMQLTDRPAENYCRPSADPLFRSMASIYRGSLLGLVLTGMGHDGLEGARAIVDAGGSVIVQDEESSVVWGMPGAVARAGLASEVLPLDRIADILDERAKAHR